MLITPTTVFVGHTTDRLTAHDLAAEQAERGVGELFACRGTFAPNRFVRERVVILGQTDELEDGRVRQGDRGAGGDVACLYPQHVAEPAAYDGTGRVRSWCAGGEGFEYLVKRWYLEE